MAVVNISGSVWSSIHFDNSCRDGDQEGFLIGEVTYRETTDISDSQMDRKTEEVDINVTSHCHCREPFSFYDTSGHVDQIKMLALLRSNYKNVIGFYRFRRNTMLQPSLREMALYQRLLASLPGEPQPATFILGIFSGNSTSNLATHSFPYQLFTYSFNGFSARKVSVVNLGDTAESEYKLSPVQSSLSSDNGGFQHILKNYSTQLLGPNATLSGVQTVRNLNNDIHNKLQEVKQKVTDTEGRLGTLGQEVSELRRRAQRQRHDKAERQRVAGQVLNTNNNAGLPRLPPSTSYEKQLPLAMETKPTSTVSNTSSSASGDCLGSHPTIANQSAEKRSPLGTSIPDNSVVEEPMEAKPSDPFAGLLKDMKQSLSKSRSSSINSTGKDSSSMEGPAQGSVNGADNRTLESREAEGKSQEASQNPEVNNEMNDDDDETQIQDEQHYNATLSPTF
ncbi:BRISC complex subunit Abraxas 2 [Strongylocentrotus purpuratus]|uniref:MPN domain-containing protein n=1 Tax=Strongylocentrotus purpuratus TaxID=7668 RepID=A0A7M7NSU8_STRPU|nr:BRISC complex subunit Abraxas 2 [Strongylocentrotus purpuratus]